MVRKEADSGKCEIMDSLVVVFLRGSLLGRLRRFPAEVFVFLDVLEGVLHVAHRADAETQHFVRSLRFHSPFAPRTRNPLFRVQNVACLFVSEFRWN